MGKCNSKIPVEELLDLSNQTHFDQKELKQWYSGFIKDCPDGELNRKQFCELYCGFYDSGSAEKFAAHVFRTFDKNNDGKIDFREFIISLSITTRGSIDEKLSWAFNIYDVDGDGFITKKEMLSIVKSVQRMVGAMTDRRLSAENILKTFNNMDRNQDGKLSLEEFIKGAKEDETFVKMLQAYS